MSIFKEKKKLIFSIIIDIFICIFALGILFLYLSDKTIIEVSSPSNTIDGDSIISIPNVNKDNTTFKISDTKKKVKSVNITVTNRLDEYNLCYYITFDSNASSDINNSDYSVLNDTILIIDENCTIYFKYELNCNYSNEIYEIKISNIKISETNSEKVSEKELKEANVNKNEIKQQSTSPYFIKVNYGANVVTIYTKDEKGNYTVPYKAMVCSCGTYTPKSGTYKTTNKYAWRPLVHDVYGQYATRIVKKILFHSVPYSTNKKDALLYEDYDKLGTTASEGCVRLTVKDAKWIYDNCPSSTMVEFYSDSKPGPLGKPSAQKISSNIECRNWDPTDPASENPWHTYKKEEEKPSGNIQNNIITDIINNIANNNEINEIINSTVNNNIINNLANDSTNNTIDNNIDNEITNENVNNSVIDNSTIDNSSSINNTIINTNSTVNNSVADSTTNINDNSSFQNNAINESINSTYNNTTQNIV